MNRIFVSLIFLVLSNFALAQPNISSPTDGTTLTSDTVQFTFDNDGNTIQEYWLSVGTQWGNWNIYNGGTTGSSITVTNIPTDGSTLYGVLNYKISGSWAGSFNYEWTAVHATPVTDDLTLYVPSEYSTIQDALAALNSRSIRESATVTIQVADGTYTNYDPIYPNHPNGKHIQILGNTSDPSSCTIEFKSGNGLVISDGAILGYLDGFTFEGYSTSVGAGIMAEQNATLICGPNMVMDGWNTGVNAVRAGTIYADYVTSKNNGNNGFTSDSGGYVRARYATSTNNGAYGVSVSHGGVISLENSTITNNTSYAVNAIYNGVAVTTSSSMSGNGGGLNTSDGGQIHN